ncbi:MAG: hypothetical protein AAGC68_04080 [Verrucomicrobiota bacterium]
MKKILTLAAILVAGMAVGLAQAEEGSKGKGGKGGKGGKDMDPAKRAEMMLEKLDKDGSDTISREEFAASPMAERMKGKEDMLNKFFDSRDANGDGELDLAELSKPMRGGKGKPGGKKPGGGKPDADGGDS